MISPGLGWRDIRTHRVRSLLAVIGIVIGVAAIASMGILGNGLTVSVSGTIASAGDTIVVTPNVTAAETATPNASAGIDTGLRITGRQVDEIRRVAGQNPVIPIHAAVDTITTVNGPRAVAIYAMDPADVSSLLGRESGSYLRYGSDVMVGARLAAEEGLKVGDSLVIGAGEERVRVVGILEERGVGLDIDPDEALIVPDAWFTPRFGVRDYDLVVVRVRSPAGIDAVKAAIAARLNAREPVVNVFDTRRMLETLVDTFNRLSALVTAAAAISLAIGAAAILNAMLLSVNGRAGEFGLMRAIGATRGLVFRVVLSEALLLGVAGSAAGAVLSLAGGYLAVSALLLSSGPFFTVQTLVSVLYGIAFGIGVSLLSGIVPAWRAAMTNPVDALRCR